MRKSRIDNHCDGGSVFIDTLKRKLFILNKKFSSKSAIEVLLLTFGSVWILSFMTLVGLVFIDYTIVYPLSVLISVGIIPYLYIKEFQPVFIDKLRQYICGLHIYLAIAYIICLVVNFLISDKKVLELLDIVFKYSIVAISEEVLFRHYIQLLLEKEFSYLTSVLFQSILFAFVFHSGFPLELNLIIRVPSGILLTILFSKSRNLSLIIGIHFLYDALIHIIWL